MVSTEGDLGNLNKEVLIPDRFWVGEDFVVASKQILNPGVNRGIEVIYPEGSLPPNLLQRQYDPRITLRSRLVQSGLIFCYPTTSFRESEELPSGEKMGLANLIVAGDRPLLLNDREHLGGFFSTEGAQRLSGPKLQYEVGQGQAIIIDGEEKDWWFDPLYNGIFFALKPQRWIIPPGKEPIDIGHIEDYRSELDRHVLQEFPEGETPPPFWIGETVAHIGFPPGHHGLIEIVIGDGKGKFSSQGYARQVGSHVLKPGYSPWPIRVEVIDAGSDIPPYFTLLRSAYVQIYKDIALA